MLILEAHLLPNAIKNYDSKENTHLPRIDNVLHIDFNVTRRKIAFYENTLKSTWPEALISSVFIITII